MPETHPSTEPSRDISRRNFLRSAVGVGIGAVIGAVVTPALSEQVVRGTTALTGVAAGNASANQVIETSCGNQPTAECLDEKVWTTSDRLSAMVIGPIAEEMLFRGVPIAVADRGRGIRRLLYGHELQKPTRRHAIAGAISSVVFGFYHNMNFSTGAFNTQYIPSSQIVDGAINYGLAYVFGLPAAVVSHGLHNTVQIAKMTGR